MGQIVWVVALLAALALGAYSIRWWILHAPLRVYHDGEADWYVARSARDAAAMQRQSSGLSRRDQEWEFCALPDDRELTILVDDRGQITDFGERLTLTCAQWVARNGRGILCSLEY
jgi:hypothetical protein